MDLLIALIGVGIVVGALVISRRNRARVKARSATVEMVIDEDRIYRKLADGREESAIWADLTMIELVGTPVKTADSAVCFALLYESETSGVLVPLGVGYDDEFLRQVTRLPGFSLASFEEQRKQKSPYRETCWNSPTASS